MAVDDIVIQTVETPKQLDRFIRFPYTLYKRDRNWVPPLISEQKTLLSVKKNPFFQHTRVQYFLALKGEAVVGRIAALVDQNHNLFHEEKTGFFGFFETVEDYRVAELLLSHAKAWVNEQGMACFRGPVNPNQNEECGLLVDAFDSPPVIMMTYNPPYYAAFIERFGLKRVRDLYAFYIDDKNPPPEKLVRVAEAVRKRQKLTVRPINMKNFDEEAEKVWQVYNNAWSKNWGFVPMTREEFGHLGVRLKQIIVPDLALMAEIDGKPVGFSLSLPDYNRALIHLKGKLAPFGFVKLLWYSRKIDFIRIVIMGVVREYQRMGIDSIFYLDTWRNAVKRGYWRGEMSWILDNNEMMNRSAKMLGGKVYKTYRMYEIEIT